MVLHIVFPEKKPTIRSFHTVTISMYLKLDEEELWVKENAQVARKTL